MIFIRLLFAFIFVFLTSLYAAEDVENIANGSVKIHLYKSLIEDRSIRFSIEKPVRVNRFECINLVTDDLTRKWIINRGFSDREPIFEILQTWNFTDEDSSSLRTFLKSKGFDSGLPLEEVIMKFQKVSGVSEFLEEIKTLPKNISTNKDDNQYNSSTNRVFFITSGVFSAVCGSLIIYRLLSENNVSKL